jgi:chitin synthase
VLTPKVRAENTYLLALDGDVDFQPEAIIKLVDLMKRNPDVGAACGRIHPTGSGIHTNLVVRGYL